LFEQVFYDQLGLAQSLAPKKKLRFKNKLLRGCLKSSGRSRLTVRGLGFAPAVWKLEWGNIVGEIMTESGLFKHPLRASKKTSWASRSNSYMQDSYHTNNECISCMEVCRPPRKHLPSPGSL